MSTILGQTRKGFDGPAYRYIRSTDKLPSLEEAYNTDDPVCRVKLFGGGSWSWFIAGFDPKSGIAYGMVHGFEHEAGDFDVNEIAAVAFKPFGLPVERDLHWAPQPISALA